MSHQYACTYRKECELPCVKKPTEDRKLYHDHKGIFTVTDAFIRKHPKKKKKEKERGKKKALQKRFH